MPINTEALQAELSDRYSIEKEIGSGRMAVVFLGEDLRHHRKVGIKVLRADVTASLGAKRFLREIDISAHLTHPHVLPLYDSGEAAGYLYYVTPYIDGETLRERLERERVLPVAEACRIAREVGDALAYAHGLGFVHRDIKPENILLSGGHATVADFGLARALEESGGERLTQTGIAIGAPLYSSPEQATGDGPIDGRTDQYSLATVLYEMLTGEQPFSGSSARAILTRKTSEAPTSLRSIRETVPAHLETVVMKGLAKLPADRYRTIKEFCGHLSEVPSSAHSAAPQAAFSNATADGTDSAPASFWRELKRRHVYQTAAVYAGVAWALVEVADITFPRLNLPDSAVTFIIVVAILGFPLAIALAWVFEVTRDGIRRT